MSKRPTAIHLDRLAQSMERYGYKPKRHELLDIASAAFGYRNQNEFTAANLTAPVAEPIGTIEIQGSVIVLARDPMSDAVFAVEESFLSQVSGETRAETYLPTPYGHLTDVSKLLDENIPNLDREQVITSYIQQQANDDAFVIEAIDHDERLYWNDQDGFVNLAGATRYPDQSGNLPSVGLNPVWRTVREAKELKSISESWYGVYAWELAKKIVATLPEDQREINANFTPQAWINDYATEVDCEDDRDYNVILDVIAGAIQHNAETIEEHLDGLGDNDEFQTAEEAPDWVRDWSGPFDIEIDCPTNLLVLNINEMKQKVEAA